MGDLPAAVGGRSTLRQDEPDADAEGPLGLGQLGGRRRRRLPPVLPPGPPRARATPGCGMPTPPSGHARSRDLVYWEVLPDALGASRAPGTTSRSGPARSCAATTDAGGCSTPRSTVAGTGFVTSGSAWRSPTTWWPGTRSAPSRCCPSTRGGTRRWTATRRPARPGATRWSSRTRAATAGTCSSAPGRSAPSRTTTASSPTPAVTTCARGSWARRSVRPAPASASSRWRR